MGINRPFIISNCPGFPSTYRRELNNEIIFQRKTKARNDRPFHYQKKSCEILLTTAGRVKLIICGRDLDECYLSLTWFGTPHTTRNVTKKQENLFKLQIWDIKWRIIMYNRS